MVRLISLKNSRKCYIRPQYPALFNVSIPNLKTMLLSG